jgi:hypothetical protein
VSKEETGALGVVQGGLPAPGPYSKIPSLVSTDFGQPICHVAFPLLTHKGDSWHVMGTAVRVGGNMAITAKHVIAECLATYDGIPMPNEGHSNIDGGFNISAVQFVSADHAVMWDVRKIYGSAHTDIALLLMIPQWNPPPDPADGPTVTMDLRPPMPGSRVVAFGYANGAVDVSATIEAKLAPYTSVGEVVEFHPRGRDRRLPFPCFQTNARFDGGMSGGPVFTDDGHLCGLICSNMPPFSADEDHVSYVALLWPSLATIVDADRPGAPSGISYPALELAREGLIRVEGWERIRLGEPGGPVSFNKAGLW